MDPWTTPGPFLGRSDATLKLLALVDRAAAFDVPLLLTGETGTGKSHLARLVHARSPRRSAPFVSVNCAGVPEALFESELFGHARGAFTGAVASRIGLFEEAAGGTLFLDEVGELPLTQQAKLLTVLEDRRVRAVGASRDRAVDVRVVSATSRDLAAAVESGTFRPDLYHRLALLRCEIPPLRARPDDVAQIARHLLDELIRKHRRTGATVSHAAWQLLLAHPWPGNVRELAHVLEAALIMAGGLTIGPDEIEPLLALPQSRGHAHTVTPSSRRYSFFGADADEREVIRAALVRCRGNRTRAAAELGMTRNTLREKLRRHGLDGRERSDLSEPTRGEAASES
jgi:DNA-binding NtrC family response regulator